MTELQKAIKAELRRINKAAKRLETRGYEINQIPKYNPKRATKKELARLKKVKTKQLKEARGTTYHGAATYGESVSGKEGAKAERRAAARKAAATRAERKTKGALPNIETLKQVINMVSNLPDWLSYRYSGIWVEGETITSEKNFMLQLLEQQLSIANKNITDYYVRVFDSIQEDCEVIHHESKGEKIKRAIANLAETIKGAPLTTDEKYSLADYAESFEDWEG